MCRKKNIEAEVSALRAEILYCPATGSMTWKQTRSPKAKAGSPAFACLRGDGYFCGNYRRKVYLAHRIAWALVHGEWPEEIDHIDGDRSNNAIANLRAVDRQENAKNLQRRINSCAPFPGLSKIKSTGRWRVRVARLHIGVYDNFDQALVARKAAEITHGFHPNHGRAAS
jgi:hypothetical protein